MQRFLKRRLRIAATVFVTSFSVHSNEPTPLLTTYAVEIKSASLQRPTGLMCHPDTLSVVASDKRRSVITTLDFEGRVESEQRLAIANKDWQGLAQDEEFIYIADTGNMRGTRKDLSVYRMDKGFLGLVDNIQINYESNQPDTNQAHEHEFDAAAIALDEDSLFLFSKHKTLSRSHVYKMNVVEDEQTLNPFHTLVNLPGPVEGAAFDSRIEKFYLVGGSALPDNQRVQNSQAFIAIVDNDFAVETVHHLSAFSVFTGVCVHKNDLWLVQPGSNESAAKLIKAIFE